MCFKKKEEAAVVHQNVLYGNRSNEDYHAERYDTKITDSNNYYDGQAEYSDYNQKYLSIIAKCP